MPQQALLAFRAHDFKDLVRVSDAAPVSRGLAVRALVQLWGRLASVLTSFLTYWIECTWDDLVSGNAILSAQSESGHVLGRTPSD